MFINVIFICCVVFAVTVAIPLDTTVPPDITFTTLKEDSSPEILATSNVEANEESSERTNIFMNEELELLAMNLPNLFRRDTSYVEGAFPLRTPDETHNEYDEEEEPSPGTQEAESSEPVDESKMKRRDLHLKAFKDTHSPDPNFRKYLNRRKRRISLQKL
ncbi:uncharacterized protein LOC111053415 isoform X1 [Nilaparvata lugens]|uniref:uncharacterized protein LOC111053415 isoform X1 n=1 Tax=Nilaparvata lugens TaxID=108931 RepID=UPI00193D0884|nr:uncharacterized protein LOC111053415 isoform X1 [Nilaparvata lugens]